MKNAKMTDILKRYVEYGKNHCLDDITTKNIISELKITKAEAEILKQSDEYKQLKVLTKKFTQERQFGFGDKNGKKDEKVFLEWVKEAQKNLKWTFGKDENVLLKKYNDGDFGFRTFERFYKWYLDTLQEQNHQCYYCGTSEENLKKLFKINDNDKDKPLYSKKRGFTATLQIEKRNPNKPYNESNCALICAFCNNAKSDMVNDKNFIEFAKHIKSLLDGFINGKSNEMPFFDEGDSKIYLKDKQI